MSYKAQILRLQNVRPHPNADRLKLATAQGNQIVVGLHQNEGDIGIYFPTDGLIDDAFCQKHDLYRRKDEAGNPAGGMFDRYNTSSGCGGRVRTQRLRGEVSDGFWMPISALEVSAEDAAAAADEGFEFDEWKGEPICQKFIPGRNRQSSSGGGNPKKKRLSSIMFKEHFDTNHLGKCYTNLPKDAEYIWTEKLHGTSMRFGHVLVDRQLSWYEKVARFFGVTVQDQEWVYLNGTRRVVLDKNYKRGTGFHSDAIRDRVVESLMNNLRKGETVYGEIVGFEPDGRSIMPTVDLSKLVKADPKYYGFYPAVFSNAGINSMIFKYGTNKENPTPFALFVYRITLTNEDGHSIDYSWNDVIARCAELGINHVPELMRAYVSTDPFEAMTSEDVLKLSDDLSQEASVLDGSHFKEGVCLRIEKSGIVPHVYKFKNTHFKIVEGIIKDSGVIDIEEEASIENE